MVDVSLLPLAHLGSLRDVGLHTNGCLCPEHSPSSHVLSAFFPLSESIASPGNPTSSLYQIPTYSAFLLSRPFPFIFYLFNICLCLISSMLFSQLALA